MVGDFVWLEDGTGDGKAQSLYAREIDKTGKYVGDIITIAEDNVVNFSDINTVSLESTNKLSYALSFTEIGNENGATNTSKIVYLNTEKQVETVTWVGNLVRK